MTKRSLSRAERRSYAEGGFRFDPPAFDRGALERAQLGRAIWLLKLWDADAQAIRATLAAPSARALSRWRRGCRLVPRETQERIAVLFALEHRLTETGDTVTLKRLPALRRRGRPTLCAQAVLAGGRLLDLVDLWRQLLCAEASASRRAAKHRGKTR